MRLIDLFRKTLAADGAHSEGVRWDPLPSATEFKIARLDLRPGDILVVRCKERILRETAESMRKILSDVTKGHKILVIDGGADLAILTAAEIQARSTAPTSDEAAV